MAEQNKIPTPEDMVTKASELFFKARCMARAVLIVNTAHQTEFDYSAQREDCVSYQLEAMHSMFLAWEKQFNDAESTFSDIRYGRVKPETAEA